MTGKVWVAKLLLAAVAWTGLFILVIVFLVPAIVLPGCGNLGGMTAECEANLRLFRASWLTLPYRDARVVLLAGYAVLGLFALARRRQSSPQAGGAAT